jgi:anti-sigma B factor antagonist
MPPNPVITREERRDRDVTVLFVEGDVDLATAPSLEEAVTAAVTAPGRALIIDLTSVTFMGSAGLRVLVLAAQELDSAVFYAVVADSPATRRPIEVTALDELFATFSTLDAAFAAFDAQSS